MSGEEVPAGFRATKLRDFEAKGQVGLVSVKSRLPSLKSWVPLNVLFNHSEPQLTDLNDWHRANIQ